MQKIHPILQPACDDTQIVARSSSGIYAVLYIVIKNFIKIFFRSVWLLIHWQAQKARFHIQLKELSGFFERLSFHQQTGSLSYKPVRYLFCCKPRHPIRLVTAINSLSVCRKVFLLHIIRRLATGLRRRDLNDNYKFFTLSLYFCFIMPHASHLTPLRLSVIINPFRFLRIVKSYCYQC